MAEPSLKTLRQKFREQFGSEPSALYSSPGRTELGGNHTDHNNGKVLAASVDLDMKAAVGIATGRTIRVYSESLDQLLEVEAGDHAMHPAEKGTSTALIRGMVDAFEELGHPQHGFDAYVESRVAVGSGLSSSACFEVLIGTIMNDLTAKGSVEARAIALAGKGAENEFFGKPCGLMDQLTCAIGGTLEIDFKDPMNPEIHRVDFDPRSHGYELAVVNTGSNHADLTDEYAAVPAEMRSVARFFGVESCRDIADDLFYERLNEVRKRCGDRATLRCLHFLEENKRVDRQYKALCQGEFESYLTLVRESGDSSMKWLQNGHAGRDSVHQSVTLALALTDRFIARTGRGACRVHGGGFAGTIQAYLPLGTLDEFNRIMDRVFGPNCVSPLSIRQSGACRLA